LKRSKLREIDSLRSSKYGEISKILHELRRKWPQKETKKISERGEHLPTIGRSTDGGGGATAVEVATAFPGRCFGAIREGEKLSEISKRRGLDQIPIAQRSMKKKMNSSVALGLL